MCQTDHIPEGGNLTKSQGERIPGEGQGWVWLMFLENQGASIAGAMGVNRKGQARVTRNENYDEMKSFKPASDSI